MMAGDVQNQKDMTSREISQEMPLLAFQVSYRDKLASSDDKLPPDGASYITEAEESDDIGGKVSIVVPDSENVIVEAIPADIEDEIVYPHGRCSRCVERVEDSVSAVWRHHKTKVLSVCKVLACMCYLTYFGYCVHHRYFDEGSYILTAITGVLILNICCNLVGGRRWDIVKKKFYKSCTLSNRTRCFQSGMKYFLYVTAAVLLCVYLGLAVLPHNPQNGQAIMGLLLLILICFLLSASPSRVNWHPVFWGFIIQFAFAVLTLHTKIGYESFKWLGDAVHGFVRLSDQGTAFVFGDSFRAKKAGFFFESAGVMVFFNSCIFVLDYYGVLEFIVLKIGRALSLCLKTGPVESVVSAANIFIGLSEAPLLVRPYLPTVTRSELHAIMTCGFSSISGAFMAMFIKSGAPPNHLLTAAVISAPAALAVSKLMYPEIDRVDLDSQKDIKMRDEDSSKSILQAASDGAAFSIKLVASIMVNMMAFVSILNLLNTSFVWIGERAGIPGMTFDLICSYLMYPLAYVMGAAPADCGRVGELIGLKFVATPFVAYAEMGKMIENRRTFEKYVSQYNGTTWYTSGDDVILMETNTTLIKGFMSEQAEAITTYAICGLSAFPAIGFCLGTLVPMCPARKNDVVSLVLRAFVAGNMANFVTAAVAGVMYMET